MKVRAVETPLGAIRGRDALILADVLGSPRGLRLRGTVDLGLCSATRGGGPEREAAFEIECDGVLGFYMEELDFTDDDDGARFEESVIVEVVESPWLARMKARDSARKVTPGHRHFEVLTYDDVFRVVCTTLELRRV